MLGTPGLDDVTVRVAGVVERDDANSLSRPGVERFAVALGDLDLEAILELQDDHGILVVHVLLPDFLGRPAGRACHAGSRKSIGAIS
jgi:hypothetical protein